ncbi:MAG: radical SAM protein [Spirochaetaceae bacterium]|nr:MAG: radical SAM protein [Spirochaetaceae bacterium]
MRIVIACSSISDFYTTPHRLSGLGAKICGESLAKCGHEVTLLNFPATGIAQTVPLPAELGYLKPFILSGETGSFSFFTSFKRWGPDSQKCAALILESSPELVCISLFAFAYAQDAISLARALRSLSPRARIAAGGAGVSAWPEYFQKSGVFDWVIAGEGEEILPRLVQLIESGNLGLARDKGSLAQMKMPLQPAMIAGDSVPVIMAPTTILSSRRFYSVSVARGCPRRCRFCTNYIVHGRRFRKSPIQAVRAALVSLTNKRGTAGNSVHFNFEDDNLLVDPEYFISILELYKEYFPGASFSAENGLDYMLLTSELVTQLAGFGFTQLNLSLASISEDLLQKQGRGLSLPHFEEIVTQAVRLGLPVIAYLIAGFSEDTPESIAAALAYLAGQPVRIGISPFYAVPGLPGFDHERFDGLSPRLCLGSAMYPWNNSLSTQMFVTAFRLARLVNCMKEMDNSSNTKGVKDPLVKEIIARSFTEKQIFTILKEKKKRIIRKVEGLDPVLLEAFFREVK